MRPILIYSIIFLCVATGFPQNQKNDHGKIIGYIQDKLTGEPLAAVNVFLADTNRGAATNAKGYFTITHVPAGSYRFMVRMMGYKTVSVPNLKIIPGTIRVFKIKLKPTVLELSGVRVTADRATQLTRDEKSNAGHELIRAQTIGLRPGSLDDAYRILSTLPSVSTRNDLNTQLYIRGGSPDQNLILFDGIEILTPSRLFVVMGGGISLVNPDIIQAIELVPAGYEVDYGNKISGLMHLTTREGNREERQIKTTASLVTARACAEGPINNGRGSWILAARRSFYDLIANQMYDKDYVFPFYYDLHGKLTYDLDQDNKLLLFYSHLREGAQIYDIENENMDILNNGQGNIIGLRHSAIHSPRLASNLLLGYYTDRNNLKMMDTFDFNHQVRMSYHYRQYTARGDLNYYPKSWLRFKTGAQAQFKDMDITARVNWRTYVQLPDSINYSTFAIKPGAYWQARIRAGDWLEYRLGIRYDYSTQYNQACWNPRTKLVFGVDRDLTLWLSSGLYSQFPDLLTIIARGEPLDITRNPSLLNAERAIHNIIGVEWRPATGTNIKLEVYRKNLDELLVSKDQDEFIPENTGKGLAQGIELTMQKSRLDDQRLGIWLNYAWSSAQYKKSHEKSYIPFDYDQRHQLNMGLDIAVLKSWSISAAYHWASGFPYTPILAMQRDYDADNGYLQGWQAIRATKNSYRYPDYSRFDLRLVYKFSSRNYRLSAYIDLVNVLNHKNVYSYEWDFYNRTPNSATGLKSIMYMMPFVPSFGITVEF